MLLGVDTTQKLSGATDRVAIGAVGAKGRRLAILLGLLLFASLTVRLYRLTDPPLDFHRGRQFHSIVFAHWLYLQSLPAVPAWEREVAYANFQSEPFVEPPIVELLAWGGYHVFGGEYLWIPRLLSIAFWISGSLPLYRIAQTTGSGVGTWMAIAFYLLLPFGIRASRSFQAEPLVIMALLFALWAILRYHQRPSGRWFFAATALAGAALFVKPNMVFYVYPVFAALQLNAVGWRRALASRASYLFGFLSALPILLYSAVGFLSADFLSHAEGRFLPGLLLTPFYWSMWQFQISRVLGFPSLGSLVFIAAIFGTCLTRSTEARALLLSLWVGYLAHALFFTYHTATHDYYHLVLIPIVALSLGPLVGWAFGHARWRPLGLLALIVWSVVSTAVGAASLRVPESDETIRTAQAVGEHVHHSTRTIFLASASGLPLRYYGQLAGIVWPNTSPRERQIAGDEPRLSAEQRLEMIQQTSSPEYFIVTDFEELERQPDLRDLLERNFPTLTRTDRYVIFDLRVPHSSRRPSHRIAFCHQCNG
jgi:hypothetical protein